MTPGRTAAGRLAPNGEDLVLCRDQRRWPKLDSDESSLLSRGRQELR